MLQQTKVKGQRNEKVQVSIAENKPPKAECNLTDATKIDTYTSIAPPVSTIPTLQNTPPHPPNHVS